MDNIYTQGYFKREYKYLAENYSKWNRSLPSHMYNLPLELFKKSCGSRTVLKNKEGVSVVCFSVGRLVEIGNSSEYLELMIDWSSAIYAELVKFSELYKMDTKDLKLLISESLDYLNSIDTSKYNQDTIVDEWLRSEKEFYNRYLDDYLLKSEQIKEENKEKGILTQLEVYVGSLGLSALNADLKRDFHEKLKLEKKWKYDLSNKEVCEIITRALGIGISYEEMKLLKGAFMDRRYFLFDIMTDYNPFIDINHGLDVDGLINHFFEIVDFFKTEKIQNYYLDNILKQVEEENKFDDSNTRDLLRFRKVFKEKRASFNLDTPTKLPPLPTINYTYEDWKQNKFPEMTFHEFMLNGNPENRTKILNKAKEINENKGLEILRKWKENLNNRLSVLPTLTAKKIYLDTEMKIVNSYVSGVLIDELVKHESVMNTDYYPFLFKVEVSIKEVENIMKFIKQYMNFGMVNYIPQSPDLSYEIKERYMNPFNAIALVHYHEYLTSYRIDDKTIKSLEEFVKYLLGWVTFSEMKWIFDRRVKPRYSLGSDRNETRKIQLDKYREELFEKADDIEFLPYLEDLIEDEIRFDSKAETEGGKFVLEVRVLNYIEHELENNQLYHDVFKDNNIRENDYVSYECFRGSPFEKLPRFMELLDVIILAQLCSWIGRGIIMEEKYQKNASKVKKKSKEKIIKSYKWELGAKEMKEIYEELRGTLFDKSTTFEQMKDVFSEKPVEKIRPIIYNGNRSELIYFIRRIRGYMIPESKRENYIQMVSCFIQSNGAKFTGNFKSLKKNLDINLSNDKKEFIKRIIESTQ